MKRYVMMDDKRGKVQEMRSVLQVFHDPGQVITIVVVDMSNKVMMITI